MEQLIPFLQVRVVLCVERKGGREGGGKGGSEEITRGSDKNDMHHMRSILSVVTIIIHLTLPSLPPSLPPSFPSCRRMVWRW